MYVSIEKDMAVRDRNVIGIFDLDNTSQSKITRTFLNQAEEEGVVLTAIEDIPKSFVVCDHPYHRQIVYISQLNSSTLARRSALQREALQGEGE